MSSLFFLENGPFVMPSFVHLLILKSKSDQPNNCSTHYNLYKDARIIGCANHMKFKGSHYLDETKSGTMSIAYSTIAMGINQENLKICLAS